MVVSHCVGAENQIPGPPQKQQALLASEPSVLSSPETLSGGWGLERSKAQ